MVVTQFGGFDDGLKCDNIFPRNSVEKQTDLFGTEEWALFLSNFVIHFTHFDFVLFVPENKFSKHLMSSILRADAALKFAVSLQVPSRGDLAARAASSPFLKEILPVDLTKIDAHVFGGKAACAECLDPADQAVLQFIFHELDFFASRPENLQSYFVDVGAGGAGQGQLGGSMIQFLLEYEIPEIGASCTCAARAAGGTGYFLPQGKGKPNHLDPSGMPFIPAFTFDFIDFDKRIECHLVAPFPADVKKGRSPSWKIGNSGQYQSLRSRAVQIRSVQM
jgi:hypothetical protein